MSKDSQHVVFEKEIAHNDALITFKAQLRLFPKNNKGYCICRIEFTVKTYKIRFQVSLKGLESNIFAVQKLLAEIISLFCFHKFFRDKSTYDLAKPLRNIEVQKVYAKGKLLNNTLMVNIGLRAILCTYPNIQ